MRNRAVPPLIGQLIRQGIHDERVLAAMANVPREAFVDEAFAHQAWENMALPIGFGQTISQPYIVARMTEQLLIGKPNSVLEIGTGSGYQTAVLAQLVNHVYSVERIKTLQYQAKLEEEKLFQFCLPKQIKENKIIKRQKREVQAKIGRKDENQNHHF